MRWKILRRIRLPEQVCLKFFSEVSNLSGRSYIIREFIPYFGSIIRKA